MGPARVARTLMLIGIVSAAFGVAGAGASPDARAAGKALVQVARGDRELAAGNARRAGAHYSKALEIVPELPEGHFGLGRVFLRLGRFDDASKALAESERCYRNQSDSLLRARAEKYHRAHADATDIRRRVSMMQSNVELLASVSEDGGSRSAETQRQKMRTLQQDVSRLETEARRLEKVAESAPTFDRQVPGPVYFFMGNALQNLGRLDEAVAAWERCAAQDPDFALVHNNLAVGYWKLGRLDLAMASMRQAEGLGFDVNSEFKAALERVTGLLVETGGD